jgi:SAM-dependent methyltransferase
VSDYVERTRATYDAVSELYQKRTASPWPEQLVHLDWFASAVGPSGRAVDVGCGPGRDARALRDRGVSVVGVDLSLAQLKTGGLAEVCVADLRALPVRSDSVDGVWCQAAFLHVPREEAQPTLSEFRRVLHTGGWLYLCTTEGDGERWETERYGDEHPRWFVHHRRDDLVLMLTCVGFEVVSAELEGADGQWVSVRARAEVRAA